MNIALEPVPSSLGQRIAKVQNCMLVEVSTGVSVTSRDLCVSLCQTYGQQGVATSCLPDELYESLPHWISSTSNPMQDATQPPWSISILSRSFLLRRRGTGFLVTDQADFGWADDDVGFSDWDKWG